MIINISEQHYNKDLDVKNRDILTTSSALGILRQTLVSNIGHERLKGFLIQFGWEMGVADANQSLKLDLPFESLLKQGPISHCMKGHIISTEYEACVELDDKNNIISVDVKGIWKDSYEALEHKKRLGLSKTPVCHTLIGYSSGYMSTICKQQILAKEVTCIGKGDSECRWILKTQNKLDCEMLDELRFYKEIPIVKELEYTYEQLLEQKNSMTKLMNFQKILTEEIASGSDLKNIVNVVYDLIQIPIVIDDIDFQTIAYSGLSQDEFNTLQNDMHHYLQVNISKIGLDRKEKQQLPFQKKIFETDIQGRLIVPILVEKKVFGYCSFLYKDIKTGKLEEDYLHLGRIALAASLILLNEKTRFESFERMKGNFLEQVLNGNIASRQEIITKGRYTGLNLSLPFFLTVLKYKNKQVSMEDEFLFQEKIMETIYQYFKREGKNILIGHYKEHIILFTTKEDLKKSKIEDIMKGLYQYLIKNYPKFKFKLGISNEGHEIENLPQYYEEAFIALRLNTTKKVALFKSLGIVGMLINSNNNQGIKMIAKQELGSLLNKEDPKMEELMKTLYVFLLNGGKLEQTLSALAISMSGLLYRIKKIETMIGKNLRNPTDMYQLLLIIESLIALGELEI